MFCGRKLKITAREVQQFLRETEEDITLALGHLELLMKSIKHYSGTSRQIIKELSEVLAEKTQEAVVPDLVRQ